MSSDDLVYVGDRKDSFLDVHFYPNEHNGKTVDFIRIVTPGDKHNIIDTVADEGHKRRFAAQYSVYKKGGEAGGTPINQWDDVGQQMVKDFEHLGFRYVEQVASAPDSAFIRVQGGIQWRNKANAFLASRSVAESQIVKDQAARIAELEAKMDKIISGGRATKDPEIITSGGATASNDQGVNGSVTGNTEVKVKRRAGRAPKE